MKPLLATVVVLLTAISQFANSTPSLAEGYLLIDWRLKPYSIDEDFGRAYSHFSKTDREISWKVILQIDQEAEDCRRFSCTATVLVSSMKFRTALNGRLHITHAAPNPELKNLYDLYPAARERIADIVEQNLAQIQGAEFEFTPRGGTLHTKKQDRSENAMALRLIRADLNSAENAIYFSSIVESIFAPDPGYCIIEQVLDFHNNKPRSRDKKNLMLAVELVGYLYRTEIARHQLERQKNGRPHDAALASFATVEEARAIGRLLKDGASKLKQAYKYGEKKMPDDELISQIATSDLEQKLVKERREQLLAAIHLGARYWARFSVWSKNKDATLQLCRNILLPGN